MFTLRLLPGALLAAESQDGERDHHRRRRPNRETMGGRLERGLDSPTHPSPPPLFPRPIAHGRHLDAGRRGAGGSRSEPRGGRGPTVEGRQASRARPPLRARVDPCPWPSSRPRDSAHRREGTPALHAATDGQACGRSAGDAAAPARSPAGPAHGTCPLKLVRPASTRRCAAPLRLRRPLEAAGEEGASPAPRPAPRSWTVLSSTPHRLTWSNKGPD